MDIREAVVMTQGQAQLFNELCNSLQKANNELQETQKEQCRRSDASLAIKDALRIEEDYKTLAQAFETQRNNTRHC